MGGAPLIRVNYFFQGAEFDAVLLQLGHGADLAQVHAVPVSGPEPLSVLVVPGLGHADHLDGSAVSVTPLHQ
jgi:hypothetical protein